jgi:ABC-type antimicrobial peptide transport system permease subunit
MLIFLIFVMLAAERKKEMGIARAVGMQRSHLVRMFAFEGAVYALLAGAVGALLGVAIGWGMVGILSVAFGQVDLELTYLFRWGGKCKTSGATAPIPEHARIEIAMAVAVGPLDMTRRYAVISRHGRNTAARSKVSAPTTHLAVGGT